MKKVFLLLLLLLLPTGCTNNRISINFPPEDKNVYAFERLRWNPDGTQAAVYMSDHLYIINPDGEQIEEAVEISITLYEMYDWYMGDEGWKFIKKTDKESVEKNIDKNSTFIKDNSSNLGRKVNYDASVLQNIYEEIELGDSNKIYLSKSIKYFEVIKADVKKSKYTTLFKSSHILYGLNYNEGKFYFISVNPREDYNKFVLYRISDDKVERISIKRI